jgi:hypothetical protein
MKNALKKTDKAADDHGVDTLLLEIKEEIKRDEMVKLIKRHKPTAIAAVILLVLGVSGFQVYNHYDTKAAQKAGNQVLTSLQQSEPNLAALDKAAENSRYSDIALISKANVLVKTGDQQKALKTYEHIAKNGKERIFRDLGALNAANIMLNQDATNPKIEAELKTLIDSKSKFSYSAKDLLAVYYIQNNKKDEAKTILKDLYKDTNAPVTISHRAKQLLNTI